MEIRTNNLTFKTIEKTIVNGVSFACPEKQKTAIVGPEGSGKKAVLLMLGGFLKPSSGAVLKDKKDAFGDLTGYRQEVSLGEMDGINPLTEEQTPRENLRFALDIAGIGSAGAILQDIIDDFHIDTFADTPVKECSQLVRALTSLACCTAVQPEIIILDEPTKKLYSAQKESYWKILDEKLSGKTLVFSTKDLNEAESQTDNIIILENGRITKGGMAL